MVKERIIASQRLGSYRRIFIETALLVFIGTVPIYGANAASAPIIDTTMPLTIPPEIVEDWEAQDSAATIGYAQAIRDIIDRLPKGYASKVTPGTSQEAYLKACHVRRMARIEPYASQIRQILYARHYDLGGLIIGNIEDLNSDGYESPCTEAKFNFPAMSKGTSYTKGSALLICNMTNYYGSSTTLLSDAGGVIRDPCLSYDAKKAVFAWSKDNNGYHIWEIEIATKTTKQLTANPPGLNVSDFEPCYLPYSFNCYSGFNAVSIANIIFNSSRCFGTVNCNLNITSNLFTMDSVGRYLRRIGFDQAHTTYPTMMSDGRVMYCRWEYNDRNVQNIYGIFTMNFDGCHQTEYYGNQTSIPATLSQAREIPNSDDKVLAITGSHMGKYNGALCIIDPKLGRNGSQPAQLICPKRAWPTTNSMSGMPEEEKLFQNPYPLDTTWFLISYRKSDSSKFAIYLMNVDGERELLASDSTMSVSQPIPLMKRPLPPDVPYAGADYRLNTGKVKMTNAYYGMGTGTAVGPKTIKKIRVIQLEYRINPWFGNTGASAYTGTPIARWLGSWESKRIIGEMPVESDGSAAFIVPARKPLYFQLIDTNGCAIQSMRSWVTLQPGEKFDCYGCHEDKNITPPAANPIATTPKSLEPFFDIQNDFLYYPKHIQPILDKHCVSCHDSSSQSGLDLRGDKFWTGELINDNDNKTACRYWTRSYYNLTTGIEGSTAAGKYITISGLDVNAQAEGLKPNSFGSQKSALITKLRERHSDVILSEEEMGKLCAWIDLSIPHSGYYTDDMKPTDSAAYEERWKRTLGVEIAIENKNIQDFTTSIWPEVNFGGGKKSRIIALSTMPHFKVRFSLSGHKLIVQVPCKGSLALMDIRGRRIMACNITESISSIPLMAKLPGGLYIVKFSGAGVNGQRIITTL